LLRLQLQIILQRPCFAGLYYRDAGSQYHKGSMTNSVPTLDRSTIRPGDRLCAAVSGGADSVALLLLLHAANTQPRNALGVGLSAVHVHHGLRGEAADADLAFVEELCARLDVPLHIQRASVPERLAQARAAGQTETVEEAARNLRYEFFHQLLVDGSADSILTAHTLDDQAETVLMKLVRGAWTEGLSGIHPVVLVEAGAGELSAGAQGRRTGRILRPLLGVRRSDLVAFLESRNQPWRTDSSNADEAFTRNRVRHSILPVLREENPAIDQALANLAELAREDEARWQSELNRILPQLLLPGKPVRGGGRAVSTAAGESSSVAIEIDRLRPFDAALRRRVVRAAARSLGARLSFDETARLLALAGLSPNAGESDAPVRSGATLHLAGQLRAERSPRELRLYREAQPTRAKKS
jgi:tRNA(Ile)-lysidine synthase